MSKKYIKLNNKIFNIFNDNLNNNNNIHLILLLPQIVSITFNLMRRLYVKRNSTSRTLQTANTIIIKTIGAKNCTLLLRA